MWMWMRVLVSSSPAAVAVVAAAVAVAAAAVAVVAARRTVLSALRALSIANSGKDNDNRDLSGNLHGATTCGMSSNQITRIRMAMTMAVSMPG